MRWRARALNRALVCDAVAEALLDREGVQAVEVNPLTGSVLVLFDSRVDVASIESTVVHAIGAPKQAAVAHHHHDGRITHRGHDHDHHDHAPRSILRDVVFGGIAVAWSIAARWLAIPAGGAGMTLIALLTARRYFLGAFEEVKAGKPATDSLVSAGVASALLTGEPLTALYIVFLLNIGEYGHAVTLRRTRTAIRSLLAADDGQAWLIVNGVEVRTPVSSLHPGNTVAVYAHERIPADGVVVEGTATIDEASITGESTPAVRTAHDGVWAGTIVLSARGAFRIRVEKLGHDTVVGHLIRRVEEAEALRAPIELVGDRFAEVFVPSAVLLAIGVLIVSGNVSSAVSILLMACPCAVGLATPSPVSAAIGNAARRGILIKGGSNVEAAADPDVIVFDKTGTLTLGRPAVARIVVFDPSMSEEQLIALAATAISHSHHPLSRAIVEHAHVRGLVPAPVDAFEDLPGEGVKARAGTIDVLAGSAKLLERHDVAVPPFELEGAESVVWIASNGAVAGVITATTPLREEAAAAVASLRRLVPRFIMVTGDRAEVAEQVANAVGIIEWRAAQSPEEKYALVQQLRASGARVAMIGDGINDAPSLASADLGIAMGTAGSDVAIDAAGVALASDDLHAVATTIQLSRKTVAIIRENYTLSFAINAGGVIAGLFGLINPLIAAILHNAGAIAVVVNSSRLIRYEPELAEAAIDIEAADSCILSTPASRLNGPESISP